MIVIAAERQMPDGAKAVEERASLKKYLVRRFWMSAKGFWGRNGDNYAWGLVALLLAIVAAQVYIQYQINVWNRAIFDALEQKNAGVVAWQALIFAPLALGSIALAVAIVYARMTTQIRWRRWLTNHLIDRWLEHGRYFHLNLMEGDHKNPEYRISEDVRISTEAPVDFTVGVVSAFLSAATFVGVLWFVGGDLTFNWGETQITIPGYLVLASVLYALIASTVMVFIGRSYVTASEGKAQSEAELRYALTRLRENGESIALIDGEREEKEGLSAILTDVLDRWREIRKQYMKTTIVAQSSFLLAPVIPVILSAPKYLAGTMTLGQVIQAASAFVTVQTAFNWIVDNYPRLADWTASARRASSLLVALDNLEKAETDETARRIHIAEAPEGVALRLDMVSVALDDGTGVVKDAEVTIKPGERVLIVGESGSGKSTLIRAIAGLWPWGGGEIEIAKGARMNFLPQRPYVPVGSLLRAAAYPMDESEIDKNEVIEALKAVSLEEHINRLEEPEPWDQTLSGGEKQRLAFARLLVHKPDIAVLDEATSALDTLSQEKLMNLIHERLPQMTIISVGHRPELEEFHERKLVLELDKGGAKIAKDVDIDTPVRRGFYFFRRLLRKKQREENEAKPE
ncbi:MAG: ABC transporter ATP-binding protein/permease [Xanthobacteraceae bacterium]|nr:ABC transporter ATP-binding protein/permease [Xanthobacteraceae bacterium]MCW5673770.1 ABC transporter ATP-binding protein/permease [Xanthobacteraceae bacterium]